MKEIRLKAYGKINLSLDVLRRLENGYHEVEMVMQQILLHDDVDVKWHEGAQETGRDVGQENSTFIQVSTNRPYLPRDERNLAFKAALLMQEHFRKGRKGKIRIDIKKRIPVAAGLAGGSSNGAAVLHALNYIWDLNLDLKELCTIGSQLGSDVPFCLMGQAKANRQLGLSDDSLATHCAVATGTGTELKPVTGLKSHLLLTKPPIAVSTAEVYQGLNLEKVMEHPDTEEMVQGLAENNYKKIQKNMVNVLENFTLTRYPSVMYTKNKVKELLCNNGNNAVLMSGSGPTIFGLCKSRDEAQRACEELRKDNKETFWTRTTY